jgi:ubiquinone/menaquinone biosynthesis C-methylase UbiE
MANPTIEAPVDITGNGTEDSWVLKTLDIRPVSWFDMQMDICDMHQIPDPSFDCFFAISILAHTKDDTRAIDEIHRVLRPGGPFLYASHKCREWTVHAV